MSIHSRISQRGVRPIQAICKSLRSPLSPPTIDPRYARALVPHRFCQRIRVVYLCSYACPGYLFYLASVSEPGTVICSIPTIGSLFVFSLLRVWLAISACHGRFAGASCIVTGSIGMRSPNKTQRTDRVWVEGVIPTFLTDKKPRLHAIPVTRSLRHRVCP